MINTGIIILAAGSSTRFGSSKQLAEYNGKTLLQHVMDEAVFSGADPVIVVTGANADRISRDIKNEKARIILNEHWQMGMAGSIVTGLKEVMGYGKPDQVIITVCDQPFISSSLFQQLYQTQKESGKPIVACAYAGTFGTPVLFTSRYFDQLSGLQGEQGAKKILQANQQHTAIVEFPNGYMDIDTPSDFEGLKAK